MWFAIRPLQRWMDSFTASATEINEQCDLSAQGMLVKTKKIAIDSTPTGAEQDTGVDLPAKSIVLGVFLDVTTVEATGTTKTMTVGLLSSESGGDADGFLAGVNCAVAGVKKGTLLNTGQTLGAFMAVDESGTGDLVPEPHITGDAVSVSFTAGSGDWAEFRGDIYLIYAEIG